MAQAIHSPMGFQDMLVMADIFYHRRPYEGPNLDADYIAWLEAVKACFPLIEPKHLQCFIAGCNADKKKDE
jgi:hypothetical protein